MASGVALGLGAALVVAALGCASECDEAGLAKVASAFEAHAHEEREAGLGALEQACPSLPSGLRWSLLVDFTALPKEQRKAVLRDRVDDSVWNELRLRTCAGADEAPILEGTPEARGEALRRSCALDRYGLVAADDVIVPRDLAPFMLYEWLVAQRVDATLAGRVVRPLLAAYATPEEREASCLAGERSYGAVAEAWGLAPPWASGDVRLSSAPTVFVSASAITVGETRVLTLDAGRPARGAFEGHVSTALLRRLAALPDAARRPAVYDPRKDGPRLVIAADASTPFATLADVAFTASRTGFTAIELALNGERGVHGVTLTLPLAWFAAPDEPVRRHERGLELGLWVHQDLVELRAGGSSTLIPGLADCEPASAGCHDHAKLGAQLERYKELFPTESVITFHVDGDVPLRAFVTFLDTARGGEQCMLAEAMEGEAIPDGCRFWQPVIDLEPPVVPPVVPRRE